jgi:ribonuclease T2
VHVHKRCLQSTRCRFRVVGCADFGIAASPRSSTQPLLVVNFVPFCQVSSILTKLDKYWPSYDGTNDNFWSHEYEKHGTCAAQLPELATELDFFSATVNLAMKYDVVKLLQVAGIKPGSATITSQDFLGAIKAGFGGAPIINCSSHKLTVVGLCFDKNLSPQDCPSTLVSTCGSDLEFPAAK